MNDLSALLAESFARLSRAPGDPASPWRVPSLATVSPEGIPGIRTIVLRHFDPQARVVALHTDARSPKIALLRANPRAALHIWDPGLREQIRLDGTITIADPAATNAAWAALPATSRATYAVSQAPGTPIAAPEDAAADPGTARAAFTVLLFQVAALEHLSLAHGSHRRARFHWQDGCLTATWLVP